MDLDTYLKTSGVSGSAFADRIGVSAASVTRIRKGGQNISLELAQRIVTATGGKVSLEALALAGKAAA
jgi:DNA-binding transcriptional regulator YdaS (Cro superfamily)